MVFRRKTAEPEAPAPVDDKPTDGDISNSGMALLSFVERVERLAEEKDALAADQREVYGEMKATGFDAKIVRKLVALRKMDKADRQEMEALLELYDETLRKAEKHQTASSIASGE